VASANVQITEIIAKLNMDKHNGKCDISSFSPVKCSITLVKIESLYHTVSSSVVLTVPKKRHIIKINDTKLNTNIDIFKFCSAFNFTFILYTNIIPCFKNQFC